MEETISLKEIFEVIKERILLILFFVFGAVLLAAIISFFVLTPKYEATSQFIVNQEKEDLSAQYSVNDIRFDVELINTYEEIIKSRAILEDVVDELQVSYSAKQLEGKIRVSSAQNSKVVNVTVNDPDPVLAANIANATVEIFKERLPDLLNVDNVSVLSEAEITENPSPVAPKPNLNIAIAGPIPPNPSEILGSNRMKEFMAQGKEIYNIIILDTPPVNIVTDAQILANIADGAILVIRSNQTELDDAKRAIESLKSAKAKLIGTILNDLDKNSSPHYYY